jgi:chromosome segregation ATPase
MDENREELRELREAIDKLRIDLSFISGALHGLVDRVQRLEERKKSWDEYLAATQTNYKDGSVR